MTPSQILARALKRGTLQQPLPGFRWRVLRPEERVRYGENFNKRVDWTPYRVAEVDHDTRETMIRDGVYSSPDEYYLVDYFVRESGDVTYLCLGMRVETALPTLKAGAFVRMEPAPRRILPLFTAIAGFLLTKGLKK